MEDILEGLNQEQLSAVTCTGGPMLIVAGAGSGKTKVLTGRIAYLLTKGVEPDRIMALTFTKKAATEMKERVSKICGYRSARKLCMGTFHSVFIRFLRKYSELISYQSNFTIYDVSDSLSVIRTCLKELGLDEEEENNNAANKNYKPKDILSRISMAKNQLVTVNAYKNNQQALAEDRAAKKPRLWEIYSLYEEKCKRASVMDFDDILLNMNILIRDNEDICKEIADGFSHIMVDEYQDTNFAQYLIIKRLAQYHHNICVVGDDSQSIYAFRGAKIQNILNFKKDYPEYKLFRLEKNYRSTRNIVDAANSVIANNENRIPKNCVSVGVKGEKLKLLNAYTDQEEALMIANAIKERMYSEHCSYKDFAILYRANSQSRAIEDALIKKNIPYKVYSGKTFYERMEVKELMAYFILSINPHDNESFKRVVNKPLRGIGSTSLSALHTAAQANSMSLFQAAYLNNLEEYGLKNAAIGKIRAFCEMINSFSIDVKEQKDIYEQALTITQKSGLYDMYKADNSMENQSRASNIEELLNSIISFKEEREAMYVEEMFMNSMDSEPDDEAFDVSSISKEQYEEYKNSMPPIGLGEFLENISLASNVDVEGEDSANKVNLMTVHSSKGLEFPYVFITGMEENLFPSISSYSSLNNIEEERRLFYVALTRAEKAVCISFAKQRFRHGKHQHNPPSRFIREINRDCVENPLDVEIVQQAKEDFSYERFKRRKITSEQSSKGSKSPYSTFPTSVSFSHINNKSVVNKIPDEDFTPLPMTAIKVGQRLEHNYFGLGEVLDVTGKIPDLRAKIRFDASGEKILVLRSAKLRFPKK